DRIVEEVRLEGEPALRRWAASLGDLESECEPLLIGPEALRAALDGLDTDNRGVLERAADRIRSFAEAQRSSVRGFSEPIMGGRLVQEIAPVERAGCYAPGGRFPLPSSVLMTAVTARSAGVDRVVVASPRPAAATLAAAALAGADAVLAVGGAQAVGAMAYGVAGLIDPCDAIVGPGNAYVTAAKQIVSGRVRIDMLAGPSELLVVADADADPRVVAVDLLAQAEHDTDARPMLVATSAALADAVDAEITRQLGTLPTADIARRACANGFTCVVGSLDAAAVVSDRVAPEHLEVHVADSSGFVDRLRHYGAAFVGWASAEVLGDYGVGPNHTLPTAGTARSAGGLSVFDFLRIRTRIEIDDADAAKAAIRDAAAFARIEGLEAHARSAESRLSDA
ncbi:MAG: histidinol dehydrogenase, partial [Planctomycetota bacterium]